MNIVFDNIIFSKEKQGGISNYWYELIKDYENIDTAYFFEERHAVDNIFRKKLNIRNIIPHYQLPVPAARLLPVFFQDKKDTILYHSSFYRKIITKNKICEITTVHDFLHHKHSSLIKKFIHNQLKFAAIKRSQGIICVSNHTLKDLKKYYTLKSWQHVAVIYNGVSNDFKPVVKEEQSQKVLLKYNVNEKFLLFVGARSNYKNFGFAVELLNHVKGYQLVLVGNKLTDAEKNKIPANLISRIVEASNIPNEDLNILYNYAHALLYPSSFEGFGIPVIEAMKAGCPVLALNVTSIPEVSGGAALLFEKPETAPFKEGIIDLENFIYRRQVVEAGFENAKRFDWATCVNNTKEFYEQVFREYN